VGFGDPKRHMASLLTWRAGLVQIAAYEKNALMETHLARTG
jgi:hypothetical protein